MHYISTTEVYKPSNGQVHYADAPSTSFSNDDKFCKAVRYQQTECCAASGKPGNPFGQESPMWDKCLQHVIGLRVCSGHNGISVGGDSTGLRFYFFDEFRFNLSHHDVRIRVFRRRGERFADNCLIERDRFGGGSVMVSGGIMGRRKQISLLCKAT